MPCLSPSCRPPGLHRWCKTDRVPKDRKGMNAGRNNSVHNARSSGKSVRLRNNNARSNAKNAKNGRIAKSNGQRSAAKSCLGTG